MAPKTSSSYRNLRRAILALSQAWGGLNRGTLASSLSLSRPTVTGLIDDLKTLGWAEESQEPLFEREHYQTKDESSLGRPEGLIRLTEAAGYVATIQAGHTTVRAWLASNSGVAGTPKTLSDLDVDAAGPAALAKGLDLVAECMKEAEVSADQLRAISIGVPAPINAESGTIASATFFKSWTQANLPDEVRGLIPARLGTGKRERLPVVLVENEVNAMARGAQAMGFSECAENFLFLKLSSGIGSGLVIRGQVYAGSSGGAGEFGHLPSHNCQHHLEQCPRCLRFGCIETVASANAIIRRLLEEPSEYPADVRPSTIIKNAKDPINHPQCHRAIVDAGEQIGEVLARVLSFLDLERVIVGGVLAEADELLLSPMREIVNKYALNFIEPKIVGLDRDARSEVGLYGGIALALSESQPLIIEQLPD